MSREAYERDYIDFGEPIRPGTGKALEVFRWLESGLPKDADPWLIWFRMVCPEKKRGYWHIR